MPGRVTSAFRALSCALIVRALSCALIVRALLCALIVRALLCALICTAAPAAHALEPLTVQSEGVVAVGSATDAPPRDAAFRAALVAAVLEASRTLIPPERFASEAERLRALLEPQAQTFVLTYRVTGSLRRRASPLDPEVQEWVLPISARVDTPALRKYLVRAGMIRDAGERPSIAIRVRPVGELAAAPPAGALSHLGRTLHKRLEEQRFVLVESDLRPGEPREPRSALELARSVGADVGLELEVDWRPNPDAQLAAGGVAEVLARALRADDGSELAITRFEAAGYYAQRDEAIAEALLALEAQLAANLGLQLERNWQAQTPGERPVELELEAVSSLVQVDAVRRAVLGTLAAKSADLHSLEAGSATLRVVSSLSAGGLQERLASLRFEGFALTPVEAGAGRARLRVETAPTAPGELAPGRGQIDAPRRN